MKRILVFQHVAHEILGTLNPRLKVAGIRIRYFNFQREPDAKPSLAGYDGLVVLGGPMNIHQVRQFPHLAIERDVILEAIQKEMPTLGICLGAQLIASALGAKVEPSAQKEIGWYDVSLTEEGKTDPVLTHFKPTQPIFQWHSDTFEVPKGAVHLASSSICQNQAFRYGPRTYGFQFHLEVDAPMVSRWLEIPSMKAELEKGKFDSEQIKKDTKKYIVSAQELGDKTFSRYIDLFGTKKRKMVLASDHGRED